MTDLEAVDEQNISEKISELRKQSDIDIPILIASGTTGLGGAVMAAQAETKQMRNAGFGLVGFGSGISLSHVASVMHSNLIADNEGKRQFLFHHDAAGLVAIMIGALGFAVDDLPNQFNSFLIGLGSGAIVHHLLTELNLEFLDPLETDVEEVLGEEKDGEET